MGLIAPADQEHLREAFTEMTRSVRLLFFTQTLDCETCLQTRQILDELPPLSSLITIEEVNFILEPDRARQYGIDHVPAIAVVYLSTTEDTVGTEDTHLQPDREQLLPPVSSVSSVVESSAFADSRIRFLGTPGGYEFVSLVQAVLLAGGRESSLTPRSLARLALVDKPVTMRVFTTPTCPHCPRAVSLAHEMAFASAQITSYAVEATEFPDLARRYQVTGVPKTVVNDAIEILGGLPEDEFVEQSLAEPPTAD